MKKFKKKYNGFNLIEILLVLGLVMALSVTAFFIYNKVNIDYRSKLAIDETLSIKHAIENVYLTSNDYNGLNMNVLVESGYQSKDALIDQNCATNQINGKVCLEVTDPESKNYSLNYYGLTPKECVDLSKRMLVEYSSIGITKYNDGSSMGLLINDQMPDLLSTIVEYCDSNINEVNIMSEYAK